MKTKKMVVLLIGILVVLAGVSWSWAANKWVLRIAIRDLQFLPVMPDQATFSEFHSLKEISIPVGTEVVWINEDVLTNDDKAFFVTAHMINVRDNNDKVIKMGQILLKPGASFTFLFSQPGQYAYACLIHPEKMRGKISVIGLSPLPLVQLTAGASDVPPADPDEEAEEEGAGEANKS
jgi:plastocyanin